MARKLCIICGIRKGTMVNGKDFADQCGPCHEEGGWENTHSDGSHDTITKERAEGVVHTGWELDEYNGSMQSCWICKPELNLAKKPAKAKAAKKVQGFRRTQLNHKEMCTHAQTPKARRTCKNAFWAGVQAMVTEGKLTEDQAWEHCIKALVKPAQTEAKPTKAATYTLVSTGPKHGVVKQLKAAKPVAK
jgi:hypothetical protein